ncbi:MAG: hypothetical protein RI894_242 [Bacteroidota bacterium]
MQKLLLVAVCAAISALSLQSCGKVEVERDPIALTENVTLKANEKYTFTLPENTSDDAFSIATQAAHFSVSELGKDAAGKMIYQYTPATNYKGSDMVVISNPEEKHGQGGQHPHSGAPAGGGQCGGGGHANGSPSHDGHQDETNYIITINFTIKDATTTKVASNSLTH